MNKLVPILSAILIIPIVSSIVYAGEPESGVISWKFCDKEIPLNYKVFNGTIHDIVHLKLHDSPGCTLDSKTEYQLQIFHKSNNYTDFTLSMPTALQDEIIDVRVVGDRYLENFQFNNTHTSLEFSDFTHDSNGLVTIILDLKNE